MPGLRLGELLVRAGYVTQSQVDVALHAASEQGCKLGTALVRLGYLDTRTLARALGKLRHIMWLDPSEIDRIDLDLARKLPSQAAHRWRAVPIRWLKREHQSGDVLVAFEAPPGVDAVDELSFVLGARITACMAPEDLIDACLDRIFPMPRPAAYRVVDLDPQPAQGGTVRSNEAVLRECRASLEVHSDGCVLLVDEDQWRALTSRKAVTEFVIDYVRRHHDTSGQLTVRGDRKRHLLAHFTGHGRPVAATREPPGARLGDDDPLFHQRLRSISAAPSPGHRARAPEPSMARPGLALVTGTPMRGVPVARTSEPPPAALRSQDLARPPRTQDLAAPSRSQDLARPPRSQDLAAPPSWSHDLPRPAVGHATHRGQVRITPVPPPPQVPEPLNGHLHQLAGAPTPPSPLPAPKTLPPLPPADPVAVAPTPDPPAQADPVPLAKIVLPAFPAPSSSILTAASDGLHASLQKALLTPISHQIAGIEAAKAALQSADSADRVAQILIETLAPSFAAVLILVVKHDSAMGWRGRAPDVAAELIESVIVPLGEPSVIARAKERGEAVIETPSEDQAAVHRRLWRLLSLPSPQQVAAAPVVLKGRTVNMIYVHPRPQEDLPINTLEAMGELVRQAQEAFTRLIAHKKST